MSFVFSGRVPIILKLRALCKKIKQIKTMRVLALCTDISSVNLCGFLACLLFSVLFSH